MVGEGGVWEIRRTRSKNLILYYLFIYYKNGNFIFEAQTRFITEIVRIL